MSHKPKGMEMMPSGSNLFLYGKGDLDRDRDRDEWESDSMLLETDGERWDLRFRPLRLGLGLQEAGCQRYDLSKDFFLRVLSADSLSWRAGEASGVSRTEDSAIPLMPLFKASGVGEDTCGFGFDW